MGPGPGLGILHAVVKDRQGSCPQQGYDPVGEANIIQVCKIVENATKVKNRVF